MKPYFLYSGIGAMENTHTLTKDDMLDSGRREYRASSSKWRKKKKRRKVAKLSRRKNRS